MQNKIIITVLAVLGILVVGALLIFGGNDKELIKIEEPKEGLHCGDLPNEIVVESPTLNQLINTPLLIKGKASAWFFEGSFEVRLQDKEGNVLASSYVTAQDDWMTSEFVDFEGKIDFISYAEQEAELVFIKDNPSDLREFDRSCSLKVNLPKMETMTVQAFFNNVGLDPEVTCQKVFPVEREVVKTVATARVALEELLKGVTYQEGLEGYLTSINSGVEIQNLSIENGIARVDFNDMLEYHVGGSCMVASIRKQIEETLKQFPTVDEVIISINGRTEDILQP